MSAHSELQILTYHSIDSSGSVLSTSPETFAQQVSTLKTQGFSGISLSEAVDYQIKNGQWPAKTVVITFDDGFANVGEFALPILKQNGFTATVFVVTKYMGRKCEWAAASAPLRSLPLLSWAQAAELLTSGIEIGSHTQSHADLRRCSLRELESELIGSSEEIRSRLGVPPRAFAYPYGSLSEDAKHLAAHIYQASCTTELRSVNGDDLNLLPRIDMYYLRDSRRFESFIAGELTRYLTLRRWGRQVRRLFVSDSDADYAPAKLLRTKS